MKRQLAISSGVLAVVMTLTVMASSPLDVQGTPPATAAAAVPNDRSALPRTPWGSADLQGTWTSEGELGVPFERPAQFGERQYLTDQEYADRLRQTRVRDEEALAEIDVFTADVSNAGAVGSPTSPPPHWLERATHSRRTSLVIDPQSGQLPALTQAPSRSGGRRGGGPGRARNNAADFSLYDRCITRGLPGAIFPAVYNANTRIVQGPDAVAITYEMIHETRIVSLDDRTQPPAFRQMQGNSRGRWEGDTLVIETTGFLEGMAYRGGSRNQRLIERLRRTEPETLRYELTVIDPETWTAPWTVALDLKPQASGMYEYACHEGNYAMRNMLSAARADEAAAGQPGGR